MDTYSKSIEAKEFIRSILGESQIDLAIITGTGLSDIYQEIKQPIEIAYMEIPHFPVGTIETHQNKLIFGQLEGKQVLLLIGRFHYYEGKTMEQITFPIRVLQQLEVNKILFTNASGGLNEAYEAGEIIMVNDHINLMPENPLRGPNDQRLGMRFPDMSTVYDLKMREIIKSSSPQIKEGVYVCWQGPSLETPAEYRFLHRSGADLVGMSTVPEVIVARHSGISVMVLSIVTNVCYPPEKIKPTTIEEVIAVARQSTPKLIFLIKNLLRSI